ncbi:hypothetical protein PZO64_24400, partial [Pantoea vagans]|nr:hypothetical protein [Pantoea vagans]MDE8579378.1 hypothetical protein [Pantoea vagans]
YCVNPHDTQRAVSASARGWIVTGRTILSVGCLKNRQCNFCRPFAINATEPDYDGQVAEALSMVRALNKMTKAGMPESVRIA